MEEIDIRDLFDLIKKKIYIIIIIIIIFCVNGFIYMKFINIPKYKSSASIVLTSNSVNNTTFTTNDLTINKNMVQTYSEIVKSRKVVESVIKALNINLDYDDLVKKIEVSSVSNTEIIKISVVSSNPSNATIIANSLANTFVLEVSDIYNMTNVKILDGANIPLEPYNVNYLKMELIMFALGLVVSLILITLIYYFDNTIKSPEQVENKLGLPILGRIPFNKEKNGGKKHA